MAQATLPPIVERYRRQLIVFGGGIVGLLLLNYVLLPAPTPKGPIFLAIYRGLTTAMLAAALILVYRSARIINFATIAIGGVAATLVFEFTTRGLLPYGLALPIALISGMAVGGLFGLLIVLFFFKHPRLVLTVATLVFAGILGGLQAAVAGWFHKPGEFDQSRVFMGPFPKWFIEIDGLPFRFAHIFGFVLMVAALVGLAVFFKKTRFGIAIRGSAESADRASLLGINVKMVAVGVWTIAGLLGALATTMTMPATGYNLQIGVLPTELFVPLVAAVIARMSALPTAVIASIALHILSGMLQWSFPETRWFEVILFGVILGALILQRRELMTRQRGEASTWAAIKEVRRTPRELDSRPQIGITRRVGMGVMGLFAIAYPWFMGPGEVADATNVFVLSIVGISLVILTGWAGQISLGHFAFVGFGAVITGLLAANLNLPFYLTLPAAGIGGSVIAVLIGIPALRIRGLFLAVTTFALAIVVPIVLFGHGFLGKSLPDQVNRPKFFFFDFEDPTSLYYLLLLFVTGVGLMARALRRSRTGRVLIAVREDEQGAQSFGIDVPKARLSAFALSGFLAAMAGSLFVYVQRGGLDIQSFSADVSIQMFIMVVVGGLGSIAGGVLGPVLYTVVPNVVQNPVWQQLILGTVPIVVLLFIPGGLTQIFFGMRDALLRVYATRHHIIVPSLFADYSREAWEHQRVPLAPPMPNRGLSALRPDQRYRLTSRLWGKRATGAQPS